MSEELEDIALEEQAEPVETPEEVNEEESAAAETEAAKDAKASRKEQKFSRVI